MSSRVAVITGAGGDIGGACARKLSHGNDFVLCVDRDASRVETVANSINGGRALLADAGVPDFGSTVARAAARLGTTTAVVHALAYEEHTPADALSCESMRRSLTVGPLAAFALFRELRDAGCLGQGAALTAIGSLHASVPFARTLGYNAAHGALEQVVKTLAHEWAGDGIRVNAVVPGWIRTQGETDLYGDDFLDGVAASLPLGRFGTAEDVAAAVGFLSGTEAAYISGSSITVDGALSVSLARLPTGERGDSREDH